MIVKAVRFWSQSIKYNYYFIIVLIEKVTDYSTLPVIVL